MRVGVSGRVRRLRVRLGVIFVFFILLLFICLSIIFIYLFIYLFCLQKDQKSPNLSPGSKSWLDSWLESWLESLPESWLESMLEFWLMALPTENTIGVILISLVDVSFGVCKSWSTTRIYFGFSFLACKKTLRHALVPWRFHRPVYFQNGFYREL